VSLKPGVKKIGDHTYSCTQLDAIEAVKLQFKISKYIGEPLATLNFASDIQMEAVKSFLSNLDSDEFFNDIYMKLILTCRRVDSKGNGEFINFNRDFAGNLLEAHQVFLFALLVNYEDFISAVISKYFPGGDGQIIKTLKEKI
jgi:hypothetical protein